MAEKSNSIAVSPAGSVPKPGSPGGVRNPYLQVALTYVRRPLASWPTRLVTIVAAVWIVGACVAQHHDKRMDLSWMALVMLGMSTCAAIHMVQQFADSRARLTPGFGRVHLVVGAAVALLVAVAMPAIQAWLFGIRPIGPISLATFLFGAILCQVVYPSLPISPLVMLAAIAIWATSGRVLLQELLSGQLVLAALGLLVAGLAMVITSGARLLRMNEETPGYRRWYSLGTRRMSGPQPVDAAASSKGLQGWLTQWQADRRAAVAIRHARRASTSAWSRVCRWQLGTVAGRSAAIASVLIFGFGLFYVWNVDRSMHDSSILFLIIVVSLGLQSILWADLWRWRTPMLARELLLPVDRPTYVKQLGLAIVISQLQLCAGMSVVLLAWYLLFARQQLSWMDFGCLLGIFSLLQVWFFGVGAWFARFRSMGMFITAYVLAVYVALVPAGLYAASGPWKPWRDMALLLAGIIAILGIVMTLDAYRRWVAADFE